MNRYFVILIILIASIDVGGQIIATKLDPIKKGTSLFHLELVGYNNLLDSTRKANGVHGLIRSEELDSIAKERCIRMANKLVNTSKPFKVFHREAHNERGCSENASIEIINGLQKNRIERADGKEVVETVNRFFVPTNARVINKGFNNSIGHFKNRTRSKHVKYGTYTVILYRFAKNPYYDKESEGLQVKYTSHGIVINYECFK